MGLHTDFQSTRALIFHGYIDDPLTFTAVSDTTAVVARSVEFESEWPVVGCINENRVGTREILRLGEKTRGKQFKVNHI